MTDRHSGYIVTLSEDIREDDAEFIINALKMVKGVVEVKPVISDPSVNCVVEHRVKNAMRTKLLQWYDELK